MYDAIMHTYINMNRLYGGLLTTVLPLFSLTAQAEISLWKQDNLTLSTAGYARGFWGHMHTFDTDAVLKAQGGLRVNYTLTPNISVGGYTSARLIRNGIFPKRNKTIFYENYLTLKSETVGRLDAGQLKSVGYLMHAGPKDVGLLDTDDSDLSFFYADPSGFYAPCMTYLGTDSRDAKINYTTPPKNGWTAGVTLVQSEDKKDDSIAPGVKFDHGKGVISAVRFERDVQSVSFAASLAAAWYYDDRYRYTDGNTVDGNHTEYAGGFSLAHGAFSVGVSGRWLHFQNKTNIHPSYAWIIGAAYDPAPWGISLNFFQGSAKFKEENRFQNIMFSLKYQITPILKTAFSTGRITFHQNNTNRHFFGILGLETRF